MIGIFNNKTNKADLTLYNGEFILDSICTYGRVTEELNGEYSLDLTLLIDENFPKKAYDLIENDSLIKIDEEYGTEYFRIAQVRKTKRYINLFARHITISEILTMWCEDVRPENQNGNGTINWIFNNAKGDNWLNVSSDISNTNTAYYINKNVYEALFTADNCFLDRWGGEVYRRGFNLSINAMVGQDRGVVIRSRKNLKGLEIETNLNELTTRIYPKGFDGITINEKYIDSELINNYSKVYSKEVKFEDIKVKDENNEDGYDTLEQAQEELKRRTKLLFTKDKIDIINATYRVDFVELSKTEEYKNYQLLEKTFLGDLVTVIDENLDVDIKVRVTKRIYDILRKERISTELSNKDTKQKPPSIQDIFNKLETIPDTENILSDAKKQATTLINSGMKNSYVIVRENEILIMDTKDINTATKVWRWNNNALGYSSTGYYGEYGTAITMNGEIVADFITTGILNADLIKTGILKSFNNKTWINMEDGTLNLADKVKFDGNNFIIDLTNSGSLEGAMTTIDTEGLTIKKGAIKIKNNLDNDVMWCNSEGWLTTANLFINGDEKPSNLEIGGSDGNKGIGIRTNGNVYSAYLDFGILDRNATFDENVATGQFHRFISGGNNRGELTLLTPYFNIKNFVGTTKLNVQGELYVENGIIARGYSLANGNTLVSSPTVPIIDYKKNVNKSYLEITTFNQGTWGVDLWASDEKLKENVKKINFNKCLEMLNEDKKIGLDLIKSLNHYSFDYIEEFGGGHVTCGYLSQELQNLNDNLVIEVEQQDGDILLQPSVSNIIPNLSLAVKQQQIIIEEQQRKNEKLEERINILEKLIKKLNE